MQCGFCPLPHYCAHVWGGGGVTGRPASLSVHRKAFNVCVIMAGFLGFVSVLPLLLSLPPHTPPPPLWGPNTLQSAWQLHNPSVLTCMLSLYPPPLSLSVAVATVARIIWFTPPFCSSHLCFHCHLFMWPHPPPHIDWHRNTHLAMTCLRMERLWSLKKSISKLVLVNNNDKHYVNIFFKY